MATQFPKGRSTMGVYLPDFQQVEGHPHQERTLPHSQCCCEVRRHSLRKPYLLGLCLSWGGEGDCVGEA